MDDLGFVQSCTSGDRQAWNKFIDKYSRLIYSYIFNILGAKGHPFAQSHAQDIFQEFFCFLIKDDFKKLKSFKAKNGCSLASWLRQVAINFTIDYIRKEKPAVSLEEESEEGLNLKDILASGLKAAPESISLDEELNSLKECIEALDNDDKYFLDLHINQGLELGQLKVFFKVSRGAIDMRKSRIMDRLRDCFRSKGFTLPLS